MANAMNSLTLGGQTGVFTLPYGECSTAANTAAKTVTVDNFSLETGAIVVVKFTNKNSAASPTLNVNGTGAKSIMRYGTTAASTSDSTSGWIAGAVTLFVYDGTNWVRDYWNNSTYSNVSLGQGYATCSTAEATTAKVGTLSSYTLATGGIVSVKFTYAVPASATLNINSKGAKSIYYRGAAITANVIKAGDIATFMYSGQYHLLTIDRWQNDLESLQAALEGKAASSHNHAASNITSGTLSADRLPTVPISKGGTGATTATAALTNLGITATAAELNKLDGVTATTAELNYVDGVTSNIQTQLDGKAASSHSHSGYAASSHTHSGYVNQNAFSNVTVGSTTIAADSVTDTLTLVGSNVTLTPDATNDKVTIGITKDNVTAALGYTPPTTNTTYSAATTSAAGLMSASDKTKLDGIATGANKYTLPAANANALGGVIIGSNITNNSGTISLTKSNVTSALGYTPPTTNTTYSNMAGATSSAAGTAGLVPAPAAGKQASFLRGDGTWATPTNTTYSAATTSAAGLMSAADKTKLDGIASGANAYSLPTASSSTLGGVKTTSTVTSTSGLTACPIIGGVPYYKDTNTTYSLSSFGVTATAAELNYVDGVTSNVQTQLNTLSASISSNQQAISDIGLSLSGYAITSHTHTIPASGSWWNGGYIPVDTDGVAEHGRYIDFHYTSASTNDYDVRIDCAGNSKNTLYLPAVTGQVVVHTNDTKIGSSTKPVYIAASGSATACSTYAGGTNVTCNGTSASGASINIYAPSGGGTSGYTLRSQGANAAPVWKPPSAQIWSGSYVVNSTSTVSITSGYTGAETAFVVRGITSSSSACAAITIPASALSTSAKYWQFADESYYVAFGMYYSGTTLYIASPWGGSSSGAITAVEALY